MKGELVRALADSSSATVAVEEHGELWQGTLIGEAGIPSCGKGPAVEVKLRSFLDYFTREATWGSTSYLRLTNKIGRPVTNKHTLSLPRAAVSVGRLHRLLVFSAGPRGLPVNEALRRPVWIGRLGNVGEDAVKDIHPRAFS